MRDLTGADTEMVNTMQRIGLDLLRDQGGDMTQVLTRFHWPIHLMSHLHLHIISPSPQGLLKASSGA